MVMPAVEAAWSWSMLSAACRSSPSGSGRYADNFEMPRVIVCTRMDRERADFLSA